MSRSVIYTLYDTSLSCTHGARIEVIACVATCDELRTARSHRRNYKLRISWYYLHLGFFLCSWLRCWNENTRVTWNKMCEERERTKKNRRTCMKKKLNEHTHSRDSEKKLLIDMEHTVFFRSYVDSMSIFWSKLYSHIHAFSLFFPFCSSHFFHPFKRIHIWFTFYTNETHLPWFFFAMQTQQPVCVISSASTPTSP